MTNIRMTKDGYFNVSDVESALGMKAIGKKWEKTFSENFYQQLYQQFNHDNNN